MKKNENGQALILVLLSLSVVLTLVLYVVSRSVTDVTVSSTQEESVRAFSAAEAGIEKELVVSGIYSSVPIGDSKYSANISNVASGLQSFNYPIQLFSGDSATFWLAAHDTSGNITSTGAFNGNVIDVCWGNSGTDANSATTPAIELTVYYETATGNLLSNLSTIQVARWTSDPNTGRIATNVFGGVTSGTCPISGSTYPFYKRITFASYSPVANSNALILARVRMLYNNVPQSLAFDTSLSTTGTNQTLPSQGQNVTSTGTAGGSNREISVFQGWPEFPFDSNVVFSPASITK